jgi:hypothetical protein
METLCQELSKYVKIIAKCYNQKKIHKGCIFSRFVDTVESRVKWQNNLKIVSSLRDFLG